MTDDTVSAMFADYPDRLTRAQAAEMLGKSARTIDRFIASGELPAYRIGKGLIIAKADAIAMLRPVRAAG